MIGTFQAETDEEIAYGLVHPLASWDPIWTQVRSILTTHHKPDKRDQFRKIACSGGFLLCPESVLLVN